MFILCILICKLCFTEYPYRIMSQKPATRLLRIAVGCMVTPDLQCHNCFCELELLETFVRDSMLACQVPVVCALEFACRLIVRVKTTVLFIIFHLCIAKL